MLAAVLNIQQGGNEERERQRGNKRKQASDKKKRSERLKWNDEEIARQAERLNKRGWTTK